MNTASLDTLVNVFKDSPDPRDPKGVRHDFHGTLALVFLGLLARIPYIAHIERWAEKHGQTLRAPLGFKRTKPPVDTTISRILAEVSLEDLQNDFSAVFPEYSSMSF